MPGCPTLSGCSITPDMSHACALWTIKPCLHSSATPVLILTHLIPDLGLLVAVHAGRVHGDGAL